MDLPDAPYRSAVVGTLPASGEARVGGVDLPAGRQVRGKSDLDGKPAGAAVLWVTEEYVSSPGTLWTRLAARFPETGLWPLVLQDLGGAEDAQGRPWLTDELYPDANPRQVSAEEEAAKVWADEVSPEGDPVMDASSADLVAPYSSTFPGLAKPPVGEPELEAPERVASTFGPGRIGLVAVHRPSDVPVTIGWGGPTNYFTPEVTAAVLRSEEERLGAVLVYLSFDELVRAVRRPPRTREESLAIAAEQLAFCPDAITQGYADVRTLRDYAAKIRGSDNLYCWWD
jgi:hypothetical protein